eukprot:CFRG1439T1
MSDTETTSTEANVAPTEGLAKNDKSELLASGESTGSLKRTHEDSDVVVSTENNDKNDENKRTKIEQLGNRTLAAEEEGSESESKSKGVDAVVKETTDTVGEVETMVSAVSEEPKKTGFGVLGTQTGFGSGSGVFGRIGKGGGFGGSITSSGGFGSAGSSGGYFMKAASKLGKGTGFGTFRTTKPAGDTHTIGGKEGIVENSENLSDTDGKPTLHTAASTEKYNNPATIIPISKEKTSNTTGNNPAPLAGMVDSSFEYTTGEEDEKHVYKCRARLHQLNTTKGIWNSLGEGQLSLNEPAKEGTHTRLVLRSLGSMKLLLNVTLFDGMTVEPVNMKQIRFVAVETEEVDGESKQVMKTYLLVVSRQDQEALLAAISSRVKIAEKAVTAESEEEKKYSETGPAGEFKKDDSNLQEIARSAVQSK